MGHNGCDGSQASGPWAIGSGYRFSTCALRAPFASHTFHSCFYLCRARGENTRPPNEHSVDNPNVLTKQPTRTQCVSVK